MDAQNSLHPQLAKDSVPLMQLPLSELRLINDQRFSWLILVPQRPGLVEWFELSAADQAQLHRETMQVSAALKRLSQCDKINLGALGNMVRQLHVHIIARVEGDACWPRPVWGTPMSPMNEIELAKKIATFAPMTQTLANYFSTPNHGDPHV